MDAVIDAETATTARATMSERVYADARRMFAADVDEVVLETQVAQVLENLWTESTRVTTFIPVLALRDLRDRIGSLREPSNS
jgi:hypothetical protein